MANLRCLTLVNSFIVIPLLFCYLQASALLREIKTVKKIKSGGRKCVLLCQQLCIAIVNTTG